MKTELDASNLERIASLDRAVPDWRSPCSILYIGAGERQDLLEFLPDASTTTIVEIIPERAAMVRRDFSRMTVKTADIRCYGMGNHDLGFWWHGPEHIAMDPAIEVIKRMQDRCKIVVIGVPWGLCQFREDQVTHPEVDMHLSTWRPTDLEALGFQCLTDGEVDVIGSNITAAWRQK